MGIKNYVIDGVSCAGKTTVCNELQRRGYHAINGDRELAYQGDPATGKPLDGLTHEHHIWHVDKVKTLVADQDEAVTFFCGGSRNFFATTPQLLRTSRWGESRFYVSRCFPR